MVTNADSWKYGNRHLGFDGGMSNVLVGSTRKIRPRKGMTPPRLLQKLVKEMLRVLAIAQIEWFLQ